MYDSDRRTSEFTTPLHSFLNVAEANKRNGLMCCPCRQCRNEKCYSSSRKLHVHLIQYGFMDSYNCWTKHGEKGVIIEDDEEEEDDDNYPMFPEYGDTANGESEDEEAPDAPMSDDDFHQVIVDAHREATADEKLKLERMLADHKKLLYPTCEDSSNTKLGTTLELLQWKAENGIRDKGFDKLLKILKKKLPKDNELPDSTYEAKKVLCPLGLDVQKIHACINDCILYRGKEYENLDECTTVQDQTR